ncbi:unnamed protein product [Caenorhabditis bovis]|uniref:Uncharacterized protein n=1 Tax=Caenorhabditis bovis TaxID=2654633 RepID=A0A8S1ER30_9PELO|nr:unnamed protein product [Caenorhabditis bovis]
MKFVEWARQPLQQYDPQGYFQNFYDDLVYHQKSLQKFDVENVVRHVIELLAVLFAILNYLTFYLSTIWDMASIHKKAIEFDPRLIAFFESYRVFTIILTNGLVLIYMEMVVIAMLFPLVGIAAIAITYYFIKKFAAVTSKTLYRQQKMIARIEIFYTLMFVTSIFPTLVTLAMAQFYPFMELRRFPFNFFIFYPATLISSLNPILQIVMIRAYNHRAIEIIRYICGIRDSSVSRIVAASSMPQTAIFVK